MTDKHPKRPGGLQPAREIDLLTGHTPDIPGLTGGLPRVVQGHLVKEGANEAPLLVRA
jgi:hypothetical protein